MSKMITIRNHVLSDEKSTIIIPIVGKSKEELIQQACYIRAIEAPMAEWRLDTFENYDDTEAVLDVMQELRDILEDHILLVTIRTEAEGGAFCGSDALYEKLYAELLKQGCCDMIDVESMKADALVEALCKAAHAAHRHVVLSYHDFKQIPDNDTLRAVYQRMENQQGDILKTALMPQSEADVRRYMYEAYLAQQQSRYLCATMAMGREGTISRLFNAYTKSVFSFASLKQSSAPGQVAYPQMKQFYDICDQILKG